MNSPIPAPERLSRRAAIQWMIAAGATISLLDWRGMAASVGIAKGYGTDPDLLANYNPGDLWPLTLSETQRRSATALCDVIIPADGKSPAASQVQVVDFVDEWISAPYDDQKAHRAIVVPGLAWLEEESHRRFGAGFAGLSGAQQAAICDDICDVSKAAPAFAKAAEFFAVFRNLTAGGYYTTKPGWDAIGYVGNVALQKYVGATPEVIKFLGLE